MPEKKKVQPAPIKVSRKVVIAARIIFLMLFVIWVLGGIYLFSRVQATKREIMHLRQKQQQEEESIRREAAYRRAIMERQAVQSGTQNAVDAFKQ